MAKLDLCWIARPVPLDYQLGDITFFSATFTLRVLDAYFMELPDELNEDAFWTSLVEEKGDGILLRSHPVNEHLSRLSWTRLGIRYVPAQYRRYYVKIDGTFQEYLATFSTKSRSTLKRKVRKFAERCNGEIRWHEYRDPGEMGEFYRLARQVSRKTYQEHLLGSGLPADNSFRERIIDLASHGRARGYLLLHEEEPVAYLFCPIFRDTVLIYQYVGHDPKFADGSPGTVLQYLVLEKLFHEKSVLFFDFTEGEGPQKRFFANGCRDCADIYYLRWRWRTFSLLVLHSAFELFSKCVGKFLLALGLKHRVRKFLRSHAAFRQSEDEEE